jgi:Family of unknown function (DUF6084)
MAELVFDCLDAQPDRYAAAPTLVFRLRIAETSGATITSIALRCQLRVEPARRRYTPAEQEALADLFGDPSRWGDTLKPLQLSFVTQMVPRFTGSTEVALAVPFTYDLEVATGKYFAGLEDGHIPLLLLFSGTVFVQSDAGLAVEQVPWEKEERYPLPVAVWRQMMDLHFPGSGWLRLRRETLDAVGRFKSRRGLLDFDEAVRHLLKEAGEDGA